MIFFDEDDLKKLTDRLELIDAVDSQDWELEASDDSRIEEFVTFARKDQSLDQGMRRALIALCVSSYNSYLDNSLRNESIEKQLKILLTKDKELFEELCEYWDVDGPTEDSFNVASFLKETRSQ